MKPSSSTPNADTPLSGLIFTDTAVTSLFSAAQSVQAMLHVEAALATVQGRLGVIPAEAAAQIALAAKTLAPDWVQLQSGTEKSGVPVIELVQQLREQAGEEAASYVHWGATSQDVIDTAAILQIRAALDLIAPSLTRLTQALAQRAESHRHTLMAGRTHSQQALPITFGLKVAAWLAPLLRHQERLAQLKPRLLVVQFGGAAGTLAALGAAGPAVQAALAAELRLGTPLIPWHTQRDNLGEVAAWLSLVSSSLAKMAQDIILMAQTEVGEVQETAVAAAGSSRGGSSTMPQKNNPITSELIIAAARTNASLLAAMHQAAIQEHERGTHGWHMEWLLLPQMFTHTAAALQKALFLSEHLVVDAQRMRQNVAAANGLMMAEALTFALSPTYMRRREAKKLVAAACQTAVAQNRHLADIVSEMTSAPLDWQALKQETNYLGAADSFIDAILQEAKNRNRDASRMQRPQ